MNISRTELRAFMAPQMAHSICFLLRRYRLDDHGMWVIDVPQIQWTPLARGCEEPVTFRFDEFDKESIAKLSQDMAAIGMGQKRVDNAESALQAHISDLRKICFKQLKIDDEHPTAQRR